MGRRLSSTRRVPPAPAVQRERSSWLPQTINVAHDEPQRHSTVVDQTLPGLLDECSGHAQSGKVRGDMLPPSNGLTAAGKTAPRRIST